VSIRRAGLRALPPETLYLIPVESDAEVPADLALRVRRQPAYVLATVAGEVDIATVAQFRERRRALATGGRALVVDLDQVSFIDAAGLGVLAGVAGLVAAHGASVRVVCARPQIRRLFGFTGLDRSIPLDRTLTEALQAVEASPEGRVS
jgi:anti-anti-sigma factor